ncbi:MAG: multicopper oxidase domain-containing protein [Chloroflexi bacterium]|nr:multicopper oxidase domain-containing protein [Chloroflexota bacterium]
MSQITRREFVRYAVVGAAALAGGVTGARYLPFGRRVVYGQRRRLAMTEALVQMVDQSFVYHWAFEDLDGMPPAPSMPGPLIQAIEGEEVNITLTNNLPSAHGFRILGVPGEAGDGIVLEPGETRAIEFEAPEGGSYMYADHLNRPVNRVLGLHGPMIVMPKTGNTPYTRPTPAVQRLFNDLGTTEHFPGEPWKPERTRIWIFNTIDPHFNEDAQRGEPIDPVQYQAECLPRYFTVNGESGAYATHNHHTMTQGHIGQPHMVRIMNAGMGTDSPHHHANHVYLLARGGDRGRRIEESVRFIDTFASEPGELMDWLVPFIRPPDIPGDKRMPLRMLLKNELSLTLGGVGQSPLKYPMHGHNELSQTAAGGNYPQGMVTHREIVGDLDGVEFPKSDPKEEGGRHRG